LFAHVPWWHLLTYRIGLVPAEFAKWLYWLIRQPSFVARMMRDTRRERSFLREKRAFVKRLREMPRHVSDQKKSKVDVAIIMVSHNDLNPDCLTSVKRACEASALKTQLVVVDNHSHAYRANELVDEFFPGGICLLREGDFGFGRSCNVGADAIEADYYFFLNPDTKLIQPEIIARLFTYLKDHPKVGIVGPKIFYFDGRLQETCRRFPAWYMPFVQRTALSQTAFGKRYADHFAMRDYDHETTREVDWMQGSALFMRGDVWKRLGGFDDRFFMYFEDIDLCRRTKDSGYQVIYYPDVSLQHFHGKESARISNFVKNLVYNRIARAHIISWAKYSLKWL
jgi:GT2 family glycosyltransferase